MKTKKSEKDTIEQIVPEVDKLNMDNYVPSTTHCECDDPRWHEYSKCKKEESLIDYAKRMGHVNEEAKVTHFKIIYRKK